MITEQQLRELLGKRISGFIVEDTKDFSKVTLGLSDLDSDFAVVVEIKRISKHDSNEKYLVRIDERGEILDL